MNLQRITWSNLYKWTNVENVVYCSAENVNQEDEKLNLSILIFAKCATTFCLDFHYCILYFNASLFAWLTNY